MIGKRKTRKTLEPRLAMRLATYRFTPEISATTMISVETDSTIPRSIRNERILCVRSVSRATPMGSRKWRSRVFIRFALRLYSFIYATTEEVTSTQDIDYLISGVRKDPRI